MKDATDHELSGCNTKALDLLERGQHELRCFSGDPVATVDAALAASPELVMGHVLRAWLHLLGTEAAALPVARDACATALALPHNEREAYHLRAIELLCNGQWRGAARTLEDLSVDCPRDALALQVGQQLDFFTGDSRMLRDRIARAFPEWSPSLPGYHAVLGMYAFGLEETGDYPRAERLGREAVALEAADAWAQHAVAHVMEMQGRRDEGIAWMRGNPAWQRDSFLAVHNWWHLALYHLEQGDHDAVLEIFDGPIDGHQPTLVMELLDGCALLWRLQLRGVDVGTRWQSLAERWAPAAASGNYAFNDLHAAMAFACAGREDAVNTLLRTQAEALQRDDDNAGFLREVGAPATQAVLAFVAGQPARTVELLRPIRHRAHRFGGSHAQRDLLDQTLIAAARSSGQAALARALETERALLAEQRRPAR
ncbi:tetratricopeptide repeat protein [Aquabacterium sp. A7-Y]|uniref:tetratricopeptide repeat protein n=1 Tax=Aquabacterium sp. A7-Y TaxID=1349605 RepID=UPI00223D606F|nr:tetratricopeptide repeat protein [Aquabacterium sp. A7-Y]MCW7540431.1 tetratricopeptide repeat protein [Aquabacterium sp. A7-Y]